MCSVVGVFSRKGADVFPVVVDMLSMLKHRGSDAFGVSNGKEVVKASTVGELSKKGLQGRFCLGHSLLSVTGHGVQPFSSCKGDFFLCHNGQIYNYLELNEKLSGHSFESNSDSETILHFLEQNNFDYKKFMQAVRGSYAVGICFKDKLVAFRDFVGVRPLWFGENERLFAFASEPIALRKIGIEFSRPLLPGHLLEVSQKGMKTRKVFDLLDFKKALPKKTSFEKLFRSFDEGIFFRSRNIPKAAVLFSGGIDSSVVAKNLSQKASGTALFCCGVEGSSDLLHAEKTAKLLGLEFFPRVVQKDEVSFMALEVLKALCFFDEMQLGIGLPVYGACREAKKRGFRVVFSGAGSDEVFAGYSFFKKVLSEKGFRGVESAVWSELLGIWSKNLFRDDVLSMASSLELRLPFLDNVFLGHAMAFPVKEKILSVSDELRKHPVRKIGEKLGLPESIVNRPKKAMQYGSGFAKELEKIFR